jgi:hypothetical protein
MGKNKRQTSKNEDWVRGINENSSYGVPGIFENNVTSTKGLNEYKSYNWNRVIFTSWCHDSTGILQNISQQQIMRSSPCAYVERAWMAMWC